MAAQYGACRFSRGDPRSDFGHSVIISIMVIVIFVFIVICCPHMVPMAHHIHLYNHFLHS